MKKNLRPSSVFTSSKWFFAEKPVIYILLITYLFITFIVSIGSTILSVAISALGGYAFARFQFRGKNLLLSVILGLFMIPVLINIIPLYIMFSQIGLLNSLFGLILTFQILIIPLNIFLLKSYFETI